MKRFYKNGFSVTGVSDAKMVLLIDAGIIYMNPVSLKSIRSNYPNVCYQFIRKNLEDYVSIMTAKLLVHDELLEILSWEIEDEYKIALLKHSNTPISVVSKGYSTTVSLYILQNRLDAKDMQTLCVEYSKLTAGILLV